MLKKPRDSVHPIPRVQEMSKKHVQLICTNNVIQESFVITDPLITHSRILGCKVSRCTGLRDALPYWSYWMVLDITHLRYKVLNFTDQLSALSRSFYCTLNRQFLVTVSYDRVPKEFNFKSQS